MMFRWVVARDPVTDDLFLRPPGPLERTCASPFRPRTPRSYSGVGRFSLGRWPVKRVEGKRLTLDPTAVRLDARST
ncbi:MAG: hypothetical protein HZB16_08000 [Armatimonadetes bacterium]|nr:hypothetical protein [Armatimonadota bacterium]